jgi:putative ABC transport system substrate-binding protein
VNTTLPIVFVQVADPVGQGFVENLARPGGNVTGFTTWEFSVGGEMLKEMAPAVTQVALPTRN